MVCKISNIQHGAHHGGCTCDITGASQGHPTLWGTSQGVSPLPNLHNLQLIT